MKTGLEKFVDILNRDGFGMLTDKGKCWLPYESVIDKAKSLLAEEQSATPRQDEKHTEGLVEELRAWFFNPNRVFPNDECYNLVDQLREILSRHDKPDANTGKEGDK